MLFEPFLHGWGAIIVGLVIVLVFTIMDRYIEVWARRTYGPYVKEVSA